MCSKQPMTQAVAKQTAKRMTSNTSKINEENEMKTRTVTTETLTNGPEIEFAFTPIESTLMQKQVNSHFVVGYLVQDDHPENPMKNCDGQGDLYTNTPNTAHHLGLEYFPDSLGSYPNLDLEEVQDAIEAKILGMLPREWVAEKAEELNCNHIIVAEKALQQRNSEWNGVAWSDEDQDQIDKLKIAGLAETTWQELYDQGKLGSKLAVPVNYCANNHGPGTTFIDIATIDNCNAVWVPDSECFANMDLTCEIAHDRAVAEEYAKGVLKEYEQWCNGEVFGVVIEIFSGDGVQLSEDACWDFIGADWAAQALKEEFDDAVTSLGEKS